MVYLVMFTEYTYDVLYYILGYLKSIHIMFFNSLLLILFVPYALL